YHRETVLGTIEHAATFRDSWLRWQWQALAATVESGKNGAFVLPPLEHQTDPAAALDLLRMMDEAEVRVDTLQNAATDTGGARHPRGSFVIRLDQPFAGWPKALLPPTIYPNPDASSRPYDTTTHSLGVHMGVEASLVEHEEDWSLAPVAIESLDGISSLDERRTGQGRWMAIDPRSHDAIRVVTAAMTQGGRVHRLHRSHFSEGRIFDPGTWLISDVPTESLHQEADRLGVRSYSLTPVSEGLLAQRQPRIGVHLADWQNATDAGWTRLILDEAGVPYEILADRDIRDSDLDQFDVILLPHATAAQLVTGHKETEYPEEFAGGLRESGFTQLRQFVEQGGQLVAIDGSAQALIEQLGLPVELPLAKLTDAEFFAPGAAIRTVVDTTHPLGWGLPAILPALQSGKNALRANPESSASAPLKFVAEDLVASGWLYGGEQLAGLDAVIDLPHGAGFFTLIAIRPQFRAQTYVSFNLLFNALYRSGLSQA
ncbi:MAG TPA: hypothetical protein VFQ54_11955, partial [Thermomicrobiales bacterium]|nr:hypothetical protein [Thermomicrobiales bacterium]